MKSAAIRSVVELLERNPQVSDYKINVSAKESYELFFVKGKLETVRATDTCDREVTVYADHDAFRGDSQFVIYPSTTASEMEEKIATAVQNAMLICNAAYTLPGAETCECELPSNLGDEPLPDLAAKIAKMVFDANTEEGGSLNSVEIFLNRYTDSVRNSRGLLKTQHRYSAMVEAIPTFNGSQESVELYEQYNFSALNPEALTSEIAGKMTAVKARYQAVKPDFAMDCPVILQKQELSELFSSIAGDLNYSTVYSHGNLFHKGEAVQKDCVGDPITLTMKGSVEGNIASSGFDGDGLSLGEITLVRSGMAEHYYGSNRFGQYLGETPTGNLRCLCVDPGSFRFADLEDKKYLEVVSMSGLQIDFFNDYIGGEVRLAYYHDGEKTVPVTGISISGKLQDVLSRMVLSEDTAIHDQYVGPDRAMLDGMKIF